MVSLAETVKKEVAWYASGGLNLKSFLLTDEEKQVYGVTVIDYPVHKRRAGVPVLARIVGDYVIIEEDNTDKPLQDRLVAAGVPPEKIILAYAGEAYPDLETT